MLSCYLYCVYAILTNLGLISLKLIYNIDFLKIAFVLY